MMEEYFKNTFFWLFAIVFNFILKLLLADVFVFCDKNS